MINLRGTVSRIRFGKKSIRLPGTPVARIVLGSALVFLGLLGFLPILGFWMIPLGLLVLSVDIALIRRLRRRTEVQVGRKWIGWGRRKSGEDSRQSTDLDRVQ